MTLSIIWPRGPDGGRIDFERRFDASRLWAYWDEFRRTRKFPDEPRYRSLSNGTEATGLFSDKRLYMLNARKDVSSWLAAQPADRAIRARHILYELIDRSVTAVFGTDFCWLPIFSAIPPAKADDHCIWISTVSLFFPVISDLLLDDMYEFWKRRVQ